MSFEGYRFFIKLLVFASPVVAQAGLPYGFVPAMRAVQAADSQSNLLDGIYRQDSPSCGNSADAHGAEIAEKNRVDVLYIDPSQCNISRVPEPVAEKFSATGVVEGASGFASGQMVKDMDSGADSGRIFLTNLHAFENKDKSPPTIDGQGRLASRSSARVYIAACDAYYKVTTLCPGTKDADYRGRHAANDFAFAIIDKPVCEKAKANSMHLEEVARDDLTLYQSRDSLTVIQSNTPERVCYHKGGDKFKEFDDAGGPWPKSAQELKLFASTGPVTGVDPANELFYYQADTIHGSSGAGILAFANGPRPILLGIAVGDGANPDRRQSSGIRIGQPMIAKYKECYERTKPGPPPLDRKGAS
jgi:hypothetical protein